MRLDVGNLVTRATDTTPEEEAWLAGFLTYEDERAGSTRLFSWTATEFPAGLTDLVARAAADEGLRCEVMDRRPRVGGPVEALLTAAPWGWLYDFQREACTAALRAARGVVEVPTGGGKGECAIALALAVPVPWLFVVHRAHLVRDVAARWERRYGVAPVVLMAGMPKEPPRFALATFQWLHRHLRAPQVRAVLGAVQGLVVDEAHVQPASTFMEVSAAIPNAYYRLGLSGTPFDRADGRSIVGVSMLGPRVYRIEARTLIDLGLLAEPVITMVEHQHPPAPGADWRALEDRLIVDSAERNALVVRLVEAADKPCVCFFHRERHGRNLLRALRASRLRVVLVNGKSSPQAREKAQQAVRDGDVDVLLASGVFQEGVDLPELRDVVNAGGWAAAIPALQKLGRGTRSRNKAGETVKTSFRLLDVYDRGNRILESHAAARAHAYRGRGHRVTVGPVS